MLYLSQRDPRWAQVFLSPSRLTIGRYGCTTTSICMISDYFGCYKAPDQVIGHEIQYNGEGLILWTTINFPCFKFSERIYGQNDDKIRDALKDPNKAVILQVNHGAHWVVALSKTLFGNDYNILDPWTGKKSQAIKNYHNISGAAVFIRK